MGWFMGLESLMDMIKVASENGNPTFHFCGFVLMKCDLFTFSNLKIRVGSLESNSCIWSVNVSFVFIAAVSQMFYIRLLIHPYVYMI